MEGELFDLTSLLHSAQPVVEFAEAHSGLAVAASIGILLLLVVLAGSMLGLVEAALLTALILAAFQQGEQLLAVALFSVSVILAIANLRRRKGEQLNREIRWEVGQLHARVDDFLHAVDRRSQQLDLALAASAAERAAAKAAADEAQPSRRLNGGSDAHAS